MEHLQIFSYIVILVTAGSALAYIAISNAGHRFPFLKPLMVFIIFWNSKTLIYLFIYYCRINLRADNAVFEQSLLSHIIDPHIVFFFFIATFAMIQTIRKLDDLHFPVLVRVLLASIFSISILFYLGRLFLVILDEPQTWLIEADVPGTFVWLYYGMNYLFLIWLLVRACREKVLYKKKINLSFSVFYLCVYTLILSSSVMPYSWHMVVILLGKVFMNLFPIFWIRKYLLKYGRSFPLSLDQSSLKQIALEYNISPREQEVVELILKGSSNKKIADELYIAHHTVKNHLYRLYQKLGVKNRYELVTFFLNHKQK